MTQPIEPKFKHGDMFAMEPETRVIIASLRKEMGSYHVVFVINDKITSAPDDEYWSFEKLHALVDRKKIAYMCNIFDIVPISVLYLF